MGDMFWCCECGLKRKVETGSNLTLVWCNYCKGEVVGVPSGALAEVECRTVERIAAWLRSGNVSELYDDNQEIADAIERGDWRAKPDCPECGSSPHKLSCSTGGRKGGRLTMPVSAPEPDDHRKDEDE